MLALVDRETGAAGHGIDRVNQTPSSDRAGQRRQRSQDHDRRSPSIFRQARVRACVVNHNIGEYGRDTVHTNTIEGYFSIFKRGMRGIYQHCGEKHLHRYLAEFDFRYTNREAKGFTTRSGPKRRLRDRREALTYQRAGLEAEKGAKVVGSVTGNGGGPTASESVHKERRDAMSTAPVWFGSVCPSSAALRRVAASLLCPRRSVSVTTARATSSSSCTHREPPSATAYDPTCNPCHAYLACYLICYSHSDRTDHD